MVQLTANGACAFMTWTVTSDDTIFRLVTGLRSRVVKLLANGRRFIDLTTPSLSDFA